MPEYLTAGGQLVREAFCKGLRPEERLTVSEWADRYRILSPKSSDEPGPYRTDRFPFLREIMDALSAHSSAEFVVVMKGAQLGFTEAGNNWVGYTIDHNPGPMLMVKPNLEMARLESRQRIQPMIDDSLRLSQIVSDAKTGRAASDTVLKKSFPDGMLAMIGTHSESAFRQMPVRDLYFDEADGAVEEVEGKNGGEPLSLAIGRTRAFRRSRKVYVPSTPGDAQSSRVEPWFYRGDQRYYFVPCPHCGVYQALKWERIEWDKEVKDGETVHHTETIRYKCEACDEPILEHQKTAMLAAGEWQPTAEARDPRVTSYHINALYSPVGMYSWQDAALDLIEAKREKERGNVGPLKEWTNQTLAETWKEKRKTISNSALYNRREDYPAPVPAGAVLLTAGVDIQDDRIELEVCGWSATYESWSIAYLVLWGDTEEMGDVWDQLDIELSRSYRHESGAELPIAAAMIDASHRTTRVWEFCKTRWSRRIWCGQGKEGKGRPYASAPQKKRTGKKRRPVRQFILGVDPVKGVVMSRLHITKRGPGYCHFPASVEHGEDYGEEYFKQLTAEELKEFYRKGRKIEEWVKVRDRNEPWDCRVYNTCALYVLGEAALKAAARRLGQPTGIKIKPRPQPADDEESTPRARARGRRRRGGWATGWKK